MAGLFSHEAVARADQEARAGTDAWSTWKKQQVALSDLDVGNYGTAGARGAP